jgi:hypothetical protein
MTAYDRWLEKPCLDSADERDEFDAIVDELLDSELDPSNPNVFMEAINEGACLDNKFFNTKLTEILSAKNYQALGLLVSDFVVAYCIEVAESRAESIYTMRRNTK